MPGGGAAGESWHPHAAIRIIDSRSAEAPERQRALAAARLDHCPAVRPQIFCAGVRRGRAAGRRVGGCARTLGGRVRDGRAIADAVQWPWRPAGLTCGPHARRMANFRASRVLWAGVRGFLAGDGSTGVAARQTKTPRNALQCARACQCVCGPARARVSPTQARLVGGGRERAPLCLPSRDCFPCAPFDAARSSTARSAQTASHDGDCGAERWHPRGGAAATGRGPGGGGAG